MLGHGGVTGGLFRVEEHKKNFFSRIKGGVSENTKVINT